MIDSLVAMEERFRGLDVAGRFGLMAGDYLLATLHRPALVDGPVLAEAISALGEVADELPVLFPVHPRTRKFLAATELPAGLQVTEPLSYLDFLSLQADAGAVLTDSGGVQEETTYLNVPCFTLRANTERPITVYAGTNTVIGLEPARIGDIVPALAHPKTVAEPPPLWDGLASARVADVLERALAVR
jgi:UDP-N-acetylglucosamine 2-epimerase (non-hydrolysing)